MADLTEKSSETSADLIPSAETLEGLMKDLDAYRHVLLPINKVLEWEQTYYAAILVAVITFKFAIIWYLEPSVLTLFSLIGVTVCIIDFTVPMITSRLFALKEWSVYDEEQYEAICTRIYNAKAHCCNFVTRLSNLKAQKPRVYLITMMVIFGVLAWIGSLIDNLFLTYLLVVFVSLVPGLRKRGILQRGQKSVAGVISRTLNRNKTE